MGISINMMFHDDHGLSSCFNERAIIVTNLTKENCNEFKCSWRRCWKKAFYRLNSETFNCYTLILFSCGLIHFREICVACYACNESPKVLNLQIIIYTTRLPPIWRGNLSKGIRDDWRKSLFLPKHFILMSNGQIDLGYHL